LISKEKLQTDTIDEMDDLIAMSNELGESIGRSYEVPDCLSPCYLTDPSRRGRP